MIVDGRTQMPVQDATVTVAQGAGPRADIIAHVTNAEGVVEFDGLMAGYWVFQALGPDGHRDGVTAANQFEARVAPVVPCKPPSTAPAAGGIAAAALTAITAAVSTLSSTIGTIGAAESRLGYATTNLNSLYQNVSAAESVIRDTNMAQEYTNYSKLQILNQAGTAMLAQANSSQQSVLKLFQ